MTKIGFNVLAWSANVSEDLVPIIERLKNIGYDGVEFFVGGADAKACKSVGKIAKDLGLGVTTVVVSAICIDPLEPDNGRITAGTGTCVGGELFLDSRSKRIVIDNPVCPGTAPCIRSTSE